MEYRVGPHRIVVEDDIVFSYVNQAVTPVEMRQTLDICAAVRAQWGSLYVVTIMGPDYAMPPDARKLASEWGRQHEMTCNIIVGASLAMRTLINLIVRAHQLLGGNPHEVKFAATETDARKAVARKKANLTSEPPPSEGP